MNAFKHSSELRPRDVRRRFDRAAGRFHESDFVHRVTREGLLERLRPMTIAAATVVDLGSATGAAIPLLEKRFRRARVIAVDFSAAMLQVVRRKKTLFSKRHALQADAGALPFADASVDVVFSNLMLPWAGDLDTVFASVARVLRKDGLFVFSTLGPDSFIEIRDAWRTVDSGEHVHRFPDMHDVGDALLGTRWAEPVMDTERLTVTYRELRTLMQDLRHIGAHNVTAGRPRGLTGRQRLAQVTAAYEAYRRDGVLPASYEVVYGHAWSPQNKDATRHDIEVGLEGLQP